MVFNWGSLASGWLWTIVLIGLTSSAFVVLMGAIVVDYFFDFLPVWLKWIAGILACIYGVHLAMLSITMLLVAGLGVVSIFTGTVWARRRRSLLECECTGELGCECD